MKFWDASAVIPLCLDEPHTDLMSGLAQADPDIVAWWGSVVECRSAMARLRREGVFDVAQADRASALVEALAREWTEVEPTQAVRRSTVDLLRQHPLRVADALQLAAARVWAGERPDGQGFVCLDGRLRDVAIKEGFQVLPL